MLRPAFPLLLAVTVAATLLATEAEARHPQPQRTSVQGDLFYNYYVAPAGGVPGVPAQMYLSPRPVPANVGHTWYTYQPLYPHESLYVHNRNYWSHVPGGGWTRTKVKYGHSIFGQMNPHGRIAPPRPVSWDYPPRLW